MLVGMRGNLYCGGEPLIGSLSAACRGAADMGTAALLPITECATVEAGVRLTAAARTSMATQEATIAMVSAGRASQLATDCPVGPDFESGYHACTYTYMYCKYRASRVVFAVESRRLKTS